MQECRVFFGVLRMWHIWRLHLGTLGAEERQYHLGAGVGDEACFTEDWYSTDQQGVKEESPLRKVRKTDMDKGKGESGDRLIYLQLWE